MIESLEILQSLRFVVDLFSLRSESLRETTKC